MDYNSLQLLIKILVQDLLLKVDIRSAIDISAYVEAEDSLPFRKKFAISTYREPIECSLLLYTLFLGDPFLYFYLHLRAPSWLFFSFSDKFHGS
jgi:hypothetical protein